MTRWLALGILCTILVVGCHSQRGEPQEEHPRISWLSSIAQAESLAQANGSDILLSFEASWCPWSRLARESLYLDEMVIDSLASFVCTRIDVDKQSDIAGEFGIMVYPTIVVTDATGREIGRITGYERPQDFVKRLSDIKHHRDVLAEMFKEEERRGDDPTFLLSFGRFLAEVGMYEGALIRFDRAAGMDKDGKLGVLEEALYSLAETYMLSGEYKEAGRRFRLFATEYPQDARSEMALLLAGLCYEKAGYKKLAKKIYRNYLDMYPHGRYGRFVEANLESLTSEKGNAG